MRRAQMPAAAPIGVLLSEEAFGHMLFLPKSNGDFAIFLGGFWWQEAQRLSRVTSYYRACTTRFYALTPQSRLTFSAPYVSSASRAATLSKHTSNAAHAVPAMK